MADQSIAESSPGSGLFPEYETLYDVIASEVQGLSDQELDFVSDRWEWSKWSIRRQLSHMSSLIYRWLLIRWGDTLFPEGGHGVQDTQGLAQSDFDRRMDENQYWDLPVIMEQLRGRHKPGPPGTGRAERRISQRPHLPDGPVSRMGANVKGPFDRVYCRQRAG